VSAALWTGSVSAPPLGAHPLNDFRTLLAIALRGRLPCLAVIARTMQSVELEEVDLGAETKHEREETADGQTCGHLRDERHRGQVTVRGGGCEPEGL
jgi:hypothetical protein